MNWVAQVYVKSAIITEMVCFLVEHLEWEICPLKQSSVHLCVWYWLLCCAEIAGAGQEERR